MKDALDQWVVQLSPDLRSFLFWSIFGASVLFLVAMSVHLFAGALTIIREFLQWKDSRRLLK